MGKQQPTVQPAPSTDLYPTLNKLEFNGRVAGVMRQNGMNPTAFQQQFAAAQASGDFATKAKLANQYAAMNDRIMGGSAGTNWLDSQRVATSDDAPEYNSVSTSQAFFGSIKNGFVNMAEAVPQLLVAGAGLTGAIDKTQWDKAHKGIENTFAGMKTYVSQDYQKPLASYDDETGLNFDLNFKSLVGTTGNLMSYILPGLLTGGIGTVATIGERAALRGAATLAERAAAAQMLGKAGSLATKATGISSFLQTFPAYQREALASGLDLHDATLYAIPVAGINAVIETANMGPLTKALGISEKAAQAAIREASLHEATQALTKLAGQEITPQLLMEAGQQAAKNALGVISRPQELGAFGRLVSGVGGRLKNGFLTQGIPEGGEEFFQSIVENASKQLYNNVADSDSSGRFKDPSFGQYAFDSLYGATLGALVGTLPGSFLHTRQADPTVFGYVGANVRANLTRGVSLDDMLSTDAENPARLKMLGVLDHKLSRQEITPEEHADLTGKVGHMAGIAHDFAGIDTFSESDRNTMFAVSEARHGLSQTESSLADAKTQLSALQQANQNPDLSIGEQIKNQLAMGKITQQLGGLVQQEDGSGIYAAEQRHAQHSEAVNGIVQQTMNQYADDMARPAINKFVEDNLGDINRQFGPVSYPDNFRPSKIVTDPKTGKLVVSDNSKLVFRNLERTGGEVLAPAMLDEDGSYVPAERSAQSDTYGQPIKELDTHIALASALADRSNPLEAADYRTPDNSVEGNFLLDGTDLVNDIGQLSALKEEKAGRKKRKSEPKDSPELIQAKNMASAYLQASGFLAANPKYAGEYAAIATQLQAFVGEPATNEDTAIPVGGDVNLLDETSALPDTNPLSNDTTESPQTPLSTLSDVGAVTQQPQTGEPDYAAELQSSERQAERRDAGDQLSKALDDLAESVGALQSGDAGANQRLLDAVGAANSSLTAESGLYATPDEPGPIDESVSGPESTAEPKRAKVRPVSFAKSFVPTDIGGAILHYFSLRGKINQADFDRVAGETMRKGDGGGNPYLNYLDGANRQQGLDSIARSIGDSLGLTDYDQQSVEQAIVDTILGFRKGYGPSVQLQERYGSENAQAETEAALADALDSMDESDRVMWESAPEAVDEILAQADEIADSYSDEEVAMLVEAITQNGYLDENGLFDTEKFANDAPAIRSGLLDIAPANVDLYDRLMADILTPYRITPIINELARQQQSNAEAAAAQVEPALIENGNNISPDESGATQDTAGTNDPNAEAIAAIESAVAALEAEQQQVTGEKPLTLFHGSPHLFDSFTTDKIGTGEGQQKFGWGLYFTNVSKIAQSYAKNLSSKKSFWEFLMNGGTVKVSREDYDFVTNQLDSLGFDGTNAEAANISEVNVDGEVIEDPSFYEAMREAFGNNAEKSLSNFDLSPEETTQFMQIRDKIAPRQEYSVSVIPTGKSFNWLQWDAIPTPVQLSSLERETGLSGLVDSTGKEIYKQLSDKTGSDQKASLLLSAMGFDGIRYPANSRLGKVKEGEDNYVVFDQKAVRTESVKQNGELIQQLTAEVNSQIADIAASNPVTADATAEVDIALADNLKQQEKKQKEIDKLIKESSSRVSTGELFTSEPVAIPDEKVSDEVYKAFRADPSGYVLPESLKVSIGYRLAQGKVDNRDNAIFQNRKDELAPYQNTADEALNQARKKKQGDLFAGETSGIQAEDAAKAAITKKQAELSALKEAGKQLQEDKIRVIENALAASQQQTDLFAPEQQAENQSESPTTPTQSDSYTPGDQLVIPQQNGNRSVNRPANVVSVAGNLVTVEFPSQAGKQQVFSSSELDKIATKQQVEVPQFQLNQSGENTPIGNLTERIAQAFGVNVVTDPDTYSQAIQDANVAGLTNRMPIAFRWKGVIYLSPQANANSLLHEAGGMLVEIMRTAQPDLYARGLALVKQSGYLGRVQADPYYGKLPLSEQETEAMETAIGDLGAKFVVESKRSSFRQVLSKLWDKIKSALGIQSDTPLDKMTLDDFVQQATGQLLSGDVQANQNPESGPAFQLPNSTPANVTFGATAQQPQQWKADAENFYRNPASFSSTGQGVSIGLWDMPVGMRTSTDKQFIKEVTAQTGWKLSDPKTLEDTRPTNRFHTASEGTAIIDPSNLAAHVADNFGTVWNAPGNRGFVFRQLFDKLASNTNLRTFTAYLDDKIGQLKALIQDVQEKDASDADYVKNELRVLGEKAERLLTPFSGLLSGGNTHTKTMTLRTYDFDENGNVVQVERNLPISVAMGLASSIMTQYTSHGMASGVTNVAPRPDSLYTKESNGRLTRSVYGEIYEDPDTGELTQLLLTKADSDALIDRFRNGGGYSGEVEAFAALHQYFNAGTVADVLEEKANALNPDAPFKRVQTKQGDDNYYPVNAIGQASDARAESRNRGLTLDENKRLLERVGVAKATRLSDPVSVMRSYASGVSDVVAYGRLTENLTSLQNALAEKYQGPQKEALISYVKNRIQNYQNHRAQIAAQKATAGGAIVVFDKIMRRYGRAVLNSVGAPLKQTMTYWAAKSTGIVDDKFLDDRSVLGILATLTTGGYRDITARGDIDLSGDTDRGLSGAGELDTLERPFIEALLGKGIADPDVRQRHLKRWATVISRTIGNASQFVGDAQFEDYGMSEKNLTNVQNKLRQADSFVDRYVTSANQRTDRAVVFAWQKAAMLQGQSEGLSGEALDDYAADKVNKLLYETYSMSNLAERTPLSLSDNFLYKMFGLYSSQQQKIGNMVLRKVSNWAKSTQGAPEAETALKELMSTAGWAVLFNAVGVATVSSLARALVAALSGDPVDEPDKMAAQVAFDSVKNVVGIFPGLASSAATYILASNDTINSGGNDSLVDYPAIELVEKSLQSINNMGVVLLSEDEKKSNKALDALIRDVPTVATQALGIPQNIRKIFTENITQDRDDN